MIVIVNIDDNKNAANDNYRDMMIMMIMMIVVIMMIVMIVMIMMVMMIVVILMIVMIVMIVMIMMIVVITMIIIMMTTMTMLMVDDDEPLYVLPILLADPCLKWVSLKSLQRIYLHEHPYCIRHRHQNHCCFQTHDYWNLRAKYVIKDSMVEGQH